jgi:1-piperideine-2-carboxylate/1-pyrroline-2-carboxylate reductase [NAD(P)H]
MAALPFLTGPDLRALASEADAVGFLEEALASGRVDPEEDSPRLFSPAPGGEFLIMPTGGPDWSGVKVVTVAPDNPARGKPKIQGIYALIASDDLAPTTLMDAVELTLMRTPATTVLAVKHLLAAGEPPAPDPVPVVVFGTGPQAERHVHCLAGVVGPIDVAVVGRRTEPAVALAERCAAAGVPARAGSADDVRDAAVVVCATSSPTPVVDDRLVADGAVVAAMGAHGKGRAELPPELVRRSDVVVEARASALRESGNLLGARAAEEWAEHPVANLADLVAGRVERHRDRPAVFSGVGMAWEDLVVATALQERHHRRQTAGAGSPVARR